MLQPGLLQSCCQEVPARKGFLDGHLFHLEMLLKVPAATGEEAVVEEVSSSRSSAVKVTAELC